MLALETDPLGHADVDRVAAAVVPSGGETDSLSFIVCPVRIGLASDGTGGVSGDA